MFSLVRGGGMVMELGWVWSERFGGRGRQGAFLRFVLEEGGSSIMGRRRNAEGSVFHNVPSIAL